MAIWEGIRSGESELLQGDARSSTRQCKEDRGKLIFLSVRSPDFHFDSVCAEELRGRNGIMKRIALFVLRCMFMGGGALWVRAAHPATARFRKCNLLLGIGKGGPEKEIQ